MKLYFYNQYEENCYSKDTIKDIMKGDGIITKEVFTAIKTKIDGMFYCKEYAIIAEKGECGRGCESYIPRNGKKGMCKHQGCMYECGEKCIISIKQEDTK